MKTLVAGLFLLGNLIAGSADAFAALSAEVSAVLMSRAYAQAVESQIAHAAAEGRQLKIVELAAGAVGGKVLVWISLEGKAADALPTAYIPVGTLVAPIDYDSSGNPVVKGVFFKPQAAPAGN